MGDHQRNLVRIDESRQQMTSLDGEFHAWLLERRADDPRHQYHTQLGAIEALVLGALSELSQALSAISPGRSPGSVYDDCRSFDVRVLWLRRVWEFFREKFDQRDDDLLRPVLKAADEVVWSCFRPVFLRAQEVAADVDAGPCPLPFVESRYSLEAFPRELVPRDLRGDVDLSFLQSHLKALPVPLVRLPPTCAVAPWWLAYLGHELGHHIQYRLLPAQELVERTAAEINAAVRAAAASAETAEQWRGWSREIFADVYSILMMGSWAAWVMLELELRAAPAMMVPRAAYPSPWLRVYLLAETARLLELPGAGELLAELMTLRPGGERPEAETVLATRVAAALLSLKARGHSLRHLSGFRLSQFETSVPDWSRALEETAEPQPVQTLDAARLATAGTVAAWRAMNAEQDGQKRTGRQERLRRRALTLISGCREPGTRDAPVEAEGAGLGRQLAAALLARDPRTAQITAEKT